MAEENESKKKKKKEIKRAKGKKFEILQRTEGGSLSERWFKGILGADVEDAIEVFYLPGTDAVLMMKRDPFTQMPQRVLDLFKSDKQLEEERQKMIKEAIEEHEAKKAMALEAGDGE